MLQLTKLPQKNEVISQNQLTSKWQRQYKNSYLLICNLIAFLLSCFASPTGKLLGFWFFFLLAPRATLSFSPSCSVPGRITIEWIESLGLYLLLTRVNGRHQQEIRGWSAFSASFLKDLLKARPQHLLNDPYFLQVPVTPPSLPLALQG